MYVNKYQFLRRDINGSGYSQTLFEQITGDWCIKNMDDIRPTQSYGVFTMYMKTAVQLNRVALSNVLSLHDKATRPLVILF